MQAAKKLEQVSYGDYSHEALMGIVNAIDRVQAVIEFNLDGSIITANENFLKTLGYSLDEIKGKHHRIFCDPAYVATPEYQAFWQRLGRGDFEAAEYKRYGKNGKEIWINASYNPIFDSNGKPFKVIKFATGLPPKKWTRKLMRRELIFRTLPDSCTQDLSGGADDYTKFQSIQKSPVLLLDGF